MCCVIKQGGGRSGCRKWISTLFLAAALFSPAIEAQTLTLTNGVQTYSALTNTAVTVTGRCELRITGTSDPIAGSTINLASADAWLLLANLRPSVVSAGYLGQVLINGSTAVAGSNCRLEEYAMGTMIVPHAPGFTPLQVFSGPNFSGATASLGLYTYYTNTALGAFNRNIGSFKLKRGYSAAFAQNVDGTGASRVYVAQDGDLEVALVSASLNRPVSFVRVFPWRWTGKKGWAGGVQPLVDPLWSYDWDNGATSTLDAEYVPMRWGLYWNAYANINSKQKSTHVLGYNEPDKSDQANMSVATALAAWPALMQSGLRVGAPAVSDSATTGMGLEWLYSFMSEADALGYRVDYVPVHFYKCDWSATSFYNWLLGIYQQTGRPVWVTEFNNGANWCSSTPTLADNATRISQFVDMLENAPFVERYAIYNWVGDTRMMVDTNGALTAAGLIYRNKQSAMAYTQTVPAGGSRGIAQFLFETNTLDSSGYGNNGCAVGLPGYPAGHSGQAVALDGTNNYLQLPPTVASGTNFSFAAWVYWNGGANWQRIFDFGDDTTHYLFLTPGSGTGTLRFAINNGSGEQVVETTGLAGGQWQHVAVTLGGSTVRLYTNGVLAASSASVTITPAAFSPAKNYLGKSQFAADPLFSGSLDDVQIADTVLTAAQIAALQTNQPPQFVASSFDRGTAVPFVAFSTNLTGTATDPDAGDPLTYSKASGLDWLTVAADGTVSGTPGANDGGTNYYTVRVTDAAGASALAVMTVYVPVSYGNGTWTNDASSTWGAPTNWSGGSVANGAGYTANFSAMNPTADRTVTLDVSRSLGTLRFSDTSGAQSWTLASAGDVLTLDTGSSASSTIAVTNTATISAPLDGEYGFTKAGPGTLILSGANPLTGTVYVDENLNAGSGGSVLAANPGALANVTDISIRNNNSGYSTLQLSGALGDITTPAALALSGRNVNVAAIRNLSGSNTVSGTVTLNSGGGYYVFQSDTNSTLQLGGITIGTTVTTLRTLTFQGDGNFLVSGVIQNGNATNQLTKLNAGTLTLAGANTHTGTNRITGGRIVLANSAAMQNSTLDMNASDSGTLSFGSLASATLGGLTGSRTLSLLNTSSAPVMLTFGNNGQSMTYSGVLSGAGGIVKTGAGTQTLSGASSFTGATRIGAGSLLLGSALALQGSTLNLDASDSGTLSFGSFTSATLGGLAGSRNLALTNASNVAVTLTVGGNGQNSGYAGALSGSGSLVKNGAGTLVLSRSNSYTGATTVNAGTVKLSRDPIVKFTFDSVSGTAAGGIVTNDGTGGSGLNGTIVRGSTGPSLVSGKVGNALSLAGDGSYVSIADRVTPLDGATPGVDWTLAMWIKTSLAGAGYAYQGDGGWTWNNTAFYLNQGTTAAGTRVGAVRYSGGWLTGTAGITGTAWKFIAITASNSTKRIYIDGNLDATVTTWTNVSAGNQFWIGGTGDSGDGVARMNGQLDEVSIFNRSLTLAEVRALTNATVTLPGNFGGQLPASTPLAVSSGATFDLGGNSQTVASLANNSGGGLVTNSGAAAATLTFGAASGSKTFSGVIADDPAGGAISLVKNGAATAILSGANNYRGTTTVNAGSLLVHGTLGTGAVTVNSGTLGGNGVLRGPVAIQASGTLSPGASVGTLVISNTLTLAGTTLIELNKASLTNDLVCGMSVVTYGGTLVVNNLGGVLAGNDRFRIFDAASYSNAFASVVLPSLDADLAWDVSSLTNGILSVVYAQPRLVSFALGAGGDFQISGLGNVGSSYSLEATTNLAPAFWEWITNATADGGGAYRLVDPAATNYPNRFYRVRFP